jgi:CheY-like chemotaxis protein
VVDDEDIVRQVVVRMIERAGHAAIEAVDGNEALDVLERAGSGIDLVLLDLTMPRRDGLSTLREMRNRGYKVPVLVASGYSQESLPETISVAGFVPKPFRMQQLQEAMDAVLVTG